MVTWHQLSYRDVSVIGISDLDIIWDLRFGIWDLSFFFRQANYCYLSQLEATLTFLCGTWNNNWLGKCIVWQRKIVSHRAHRAHRDLKNNQKILLCVLCGLCVRNNSCSMTGLSSSNSAWTIGYWANTNTWRKRLRYAWPKFQIANQYIILYFHQYWKNRNSSPGQNIWQDNRIDLILIRHKSGR